MLGRESTTDIFETLTSDNATKPQQEFRTEITSLDEAMFDLKNVLPMFESKLAALILTETNEALLNQGMKYCNQCISSELQAISEGKAHNFITMWKHRVNRKEYHDPIILGEANDNNLYQRFKRSFKVGPQLDSLLQIHNAYFQRIAAIHVATASEQQSDNSIKNDNFRFGF